MKYSILKDKKPETTIRNIQKVLNRLNISVSEHNVTRNNIEEYAPYSLRLEILDIHYLGVNGKGTSLINAKASAYGEFIERLSNSFLVHIDYKLENENKKNLDYDKLSAFFNAEELDFIKSNSMQALSFFSVKDRKIYNFPTELLYYKQGSNGMSSGNTFEEALVQGISEICERYALMNIIFNNITPPDIPVDLYMKYDNIRGLINFLQKNGYETFIKDASLNEKLPVIFAIFKHKESNSIFFYAGAHPSLPVAIERTLTEFSQGSDLSQNIENTAILHKISSTNFFLRIKNNKEKLFEILFNNRSIFENNEFFENLFFKSKPSYKFDKDAWTNTQKNYSNKSLLKFIIKNLPQITNNLYIRNASYFNIPAVYIFCPNISTLLAFNQYNNSLFIKFQNIINHIINKKEHSITFSLEEFLELLEFQRMNFSDKNMLFILDTTFTDYLCLLISIKLNDFKRIETYTNILINGSFEKNYFKGKSLTYLKIINEYFNFLKNNKNKNEITQLLKNQFKEADIEYTLKYINNLSLRIIKLLFIRHIKRNLQKNQSLNDVQIESLNKIKQKLNKIYNKKQPNQNIFRKIFKLNN